MRKGFLIYEGMRKYFPIYEEAVSHIRLCNCSIQNFLIYEENLISFFISVEKMQERRAFKKGVHGGEKSSKETRAWREESTEETRS